MLNRKSLLDLFPQRVRSLDVPIATALRKTWAQGYDAAALRATFLRPPAWLLRPPARVFFRTLFRFAM